VKLHGCWFLQKYLSENISLFKEIQLNRQVFQAVLAETVIKTLFDVSPLFIGQPYIVALAPGNISGLTFKHRFAPLTAFCFMQAHQIKFTVENLLLL
jgi:hypothetical protein